MKEIFNEGRVVGLSHYEIYVRQLLSLNPEATPMTEREWLTSALANNISMILKIPAGTTKGIHDYVLPENSALTACTQVFGSMFAGEVTVDETGYWATRVDDYGDAISNTEELSPETPGTPDYVPSKYDPTQENTVIAERATEFLKIREALVIQPGDWEDVIYPPDPEPDDEEDIDDDSDIIDTGSEELGTTEEEQDDAPEPPAPDIDYDEIVTWESPLIDSKTIYADPRDIVLTTEYSEWLVENRTGTRREMIDDLSQYVDDPDAEIICWDTPLITESDDYEHPSDIILTTEYGEWIIGEKWGTREQMVEDLDQYKEDPEPGPIPPEPPEPPVPVRAKKYLEPDFHKNGFVRVLLTDETTNDLYILLHGFVDKAMLMGEVSFPYQGWSNRPQDGDFLGPAMFPWSCPVILTITADVQEALLKKQEELNLELLGLTLNLKYRTMYLGTLHIVTWETPLLTELGDSLLTESGENLMASKSGTAAEMWQEGDEDEILYYAPWLDEYGNDLTTEDREIIWVPKIGTITEMIAEGGML